MAPRIRTRLLLFAAALAGIALLAPAWPGARISLATGSVEIGRGEPPTWKRADEGDALAAGDRIRTGDDGRAEIALEGSTVRLYPNSLLRLPETSEPGTTAVEMDRGGSLFDVLHRGETFEVHTPEVVVSVKGTRFGVGVEADESAAVAVYRGVVGVRPGAGDASETLVHEGFAAFGHGSFELTWHGTSDDPWESWGHGGGLPDAMRGSRHEAALHDARAAAQAMACDLPRPKDKSGRADQARDKSKDGSTAPAKVAEPLVDTATALRDPVLDANDKLERELEIGAAEDLVGGVLGGGGAGGGGTPLLDITFIDGSGKSGGDVVQLVAPSSGDQWTLDEHQITDALEGKNSLPTNLDALLDTTSAQNKDALLHQLQALFH
jgi:hypothetical protein